MSDKTSSKTSDKRLDAVLDEARTHMVPPESALDALPWERLERALATSARSRGAAAPAPRRAPWLAGAGAGLLAAAAIALVMSRSDRGPDVVAPDGNARDARTASAGGELLGAGGGTLRAAEGSGDVRIAGVVASAGAVLRAGDRIEAERARAILERRGKVSWLLEPLSGGGGEASAGAELVSADQTLVLELHRGAIEAQVVPVPSGEAFAVDLRGSGTKVVRVAVHGTHLRVSREGSRVVVDLTEGVVSVGVPPRAGSTYGTLVTAPAHVELDIEDLAGSLRVDHSASAVRPAIDLGTRPVSSPREPALTSSEEPSSEAVAPEPASVKPTTKEPPRARTASDDDAKLALSAAVRSCGAAVPHERRPNAVTVSVSSTLRLAISPAGEVRTAVFDPPLLPAIQDCVVPTIYKTRFASSPASSRESRSVALPIELSF